jgi:3'-phosphoadenosine 5'-phosphosulfate sulfotransferase (PAPS reductase)/FAD synthetase
MKFVVCYSGGKSSSECALTVAKKYGAENVILLNHDINGDIEQACTKKLKDDVADYLGLEITYANHNDWSKATPVSVCVDAKAWKVGRGEILCTNRLKTAPFKKWLEDNDPNGEYTYVYGFDLNEPSRISRRSQIMGLMGYKTAFPMTWDESEIVRLGDIGIDAGSIYETFNHSNCTGCLKAGWQHWYIVYATRREIWNEAKKGEDEIGYAIHKDKYGPVYLEEKEELFDSMMAAGVVPTEKVKPQTFWAQARKAIKESEAEMKEMSEHDKGVCLDCTV